MSTKYRIVEHPWIGPISRKVRVGYVVQKKYWLFGWMTFGDCSIFDTVEDAENFVEILIKEHAIVREYE